MKKMMMISLIFILLLSGCGKVLTDEESDRDRGDGDKISAGKTKDSQASLKAWEEYPEDLPADAKWEEYPEDNIFGLSAITSYEEQDKRIVILAFTYLEDSDIKDMLIRKADSIQGMSPYGYFNFDDTEVIKEDDYYYVSLIFDKRIDLNTVLFDKDNERCNIRLKDGIQLTYCDFRNLEETRRHYQSFDPVASVWEDVSETVKNEIPEPDTGYIQYTELAVDYDAYEPVSVKGDVSFSAHNHRYTQPHYNIYGEVDQEGDTTLRFSLLNEIDVVEEQDHFKLSQKTGSGYTDITPSDLRLDTEFATDDHRLWIDIHSSLLGELEEGDYRAEYGDYTVDFRLSVQTFEVW